MHALPVVMACFFWSLPAEPKVTFRESCWECAEDEGCFQKGTMVKCAPLPLGMRWRNDKVSRLLAPQGSRVPLRKRRAGTGRWRGSFCWGGGSARVKDGAETICLPMIAPPTESVWPASGK